MIRIAITEAAFEAIARTLPLGSVAIELYFNERGERLIVRLRDPPGCGLAAAVTATG